MTREELKARIRRCIESEGEARDALLADVARWQAERVEPFSRLCRARGADFDAGRWPAVPTDVFRHVRVAAHPETDDVRIFRTSGTTSGARGVHALRDLELYDLAAKTAAARALFAVRDHRVPPGGTPPAEGRMRLVVVAPHPRAVPDSSLSYMLGRFEEWFATEAHWIWDGDVDLDALRSAPPPLALLGTSFALVHLCDRLGAERLSLGEGSLVMQTGGFKGRSRELDPAAMRAMLADRLGIAEHRVVSEYGMTELSSQLYGRGLLDGAIGEHERLWAPGWVRATPVDPESLLPIADGEVGILRIDDLANLDTACSIQTSDLARRDGDAIVLYGRAPGATPRGCSLAVEEALR